MTRNGPNVATSKAEAGRGDRSGICSGAHEVRRLARVEDPDAVAERPLEIEQVVQSEVGIRAREGHEREVAVALPGLDEERVVAEQNVVRTCVVAARYAAAFGAGLLAHRRLPVEELRRLVPRPRDLRDDECGECRRRPAAARAARCRPRREARRTGSRKIRWRVSGEPELRARTRAASGTSAAHAVSTRVLCAAERRARPPLRPAPPAGRGTPL